VNRILPGLPSLLYYVRPANALLSLLDHDLKKVENFKEQVHIHI